MAGHATSHLFPMLTAKPVGLARIVSEAQPAGEGHDIEFKTLDVRSILNRSVSKRHLSLAWSINPYRGCEFACRYCYARYTHQFLEPGPVSAAAATSEAQTWASDFEKTIYLKQNAAWLLEQELKRVNRSQEIALGTATDPYQPIERRARITRSLLEVFTRRSGYRLGVVTKSHLIVRDIDLLRRIALRNTLVLHVTITTTDPALARLLEPRAPRPDLRFQAVQRLREAGLTTGVLCSPLLPGLTDTVDALDGVARSAAQSGASFFAAQPLFLKMCSRPTYLRFVREHFPNLLPVYEEHFRNSDFPQSPYRQRLEAIVRSICQQHGLEERSSDALLTTDTGKSRRPPAGIHGPLQHQLFA